MNALDEVMSSPRVSVGTGTPVYEIYRTVAENKVRHIAITDNGGQGGFVPARYMLRRPII